jgi:UDP-N-acetylmuramoyl-tripeptide--D-alanyl-D-alanine ligase
MSALWTSSELAALFGVDVPDVTGISIDTRSLVPGDLFVALQGERDGHEFVQAAFEKGAVAALVSQPMPGPCIVVEDTLAGLTKLAAASRARSAARIVAVTGSVGKTTTKEMLRTMLLAFGTVHAAEASFNNHIGVPLTLARMPRDAAFGVFEIGMNHPGEILPLAKLVRPDVAVISNISRAHIGLMGSERAIAEEKASIFQALGPSGVAVYPVDTGWDEVISAPGAKIRFGAGAEIGLEAVHELPDAVGVTAIVHGTRVAFTLAAPGAHMAMNALAALGVAAALGLDVMRAASALDGFAPVAGRGVRKNLTIHGKSILLLDESYNASSASMRAALGVLALQPGRHVAVLGDMLEMGEFAQAEHLALLPAVEDSAHSVFCCGRWCKELFESLPSSMQGGYQADAASLAPVVLAGLVQGDAVLVKGSYGSRMRDVISLLLESAG